MGWDIANYIFGAICIIGPIGLIVWYIKGAREQLRELNKDRD